MRKEFSPTVFLKSAGTVAEYFGFSPRETLRNDPLCRDCDNTFSINITDEIESQPQFTTRALNNYYQDKLYALEKPVLVYDIETDKKTGVVALSLQIFNVDKSIAEAILIQANLALLNELGFSDPVVRVNAFGDADSITRYTRELTNFLRKRLDLLPALAREKLKVHPLKSLDELITTEDELVDKSPSPLEYLNDNSRKHFREIIEYLDTSNIPYEIDPRMIDNYKLYSGALFSIEHFDDEDGEPTITISGGRFDEVIERFSEQPTKAAGSIARFKTKNIPQRIPRIKLADTDVAIIQLGFGPKVASLQLIEKLRRLGISTHQDLTNQSLSEQLRAVENIGIRHVIIIGQKEFMEGTVLLRDLTTRKQETLTEEQLLSKLKRVAKSK